MVEVTICEADALLISELGLFTIVGLPWLHHIPSLADVTMETKAWTL
jgi:hypothetical protein